MGLAFPYKTRMERNTVSDMEDDEIILAMAICELLGRTVKPEQVEEAFEKARERFYRPAHAPRQAKISHAHRRNDQME
jgi:hypothetical protein